MNYSVKVTRVSEEDSHMSKKVKALATMTFGEQFKINNISIVEADNNRTYINMPSYMTNQVDENGNTVYKDICYPKSSEFAKQMYKDILTVYREMLKTGNKTEAKSFGDSGEMDISVAVYPLDKKENNSLAAMVSIAFDDKFVVNNIRVITGAKGEFVSMPNYRTEQLDNDGNPVYQDICYPVTAEFREKLYGDIISSYKDAAAENMNIDESVKHPHPSR